MCEGEDKKGLPPAQIAALIKEQEEVDREVTKGKKVAYTSKQKTMQPRTQISSRSHPFLPMPSRDGDLEQPHNTPRKRGPLDRAFQNELRDIADENVGRCLFANGVPFNFVRSHYFREMCEGINEAPSSYRGPRFEKLRTAILQNERKNVENLLKPIRDYWVQTGVSIVSDRWKDCKNRPLINVIVVSPKGSMFLKAVDSEGEVKNAKFIAQILIDSVGHHKVVQVIMNNAKVCKAAGALVEARYDDIFWTSCTIHSLNLVM